jgi:Ras-related protein Rab-2A
MSMLDPYDLRFKICILGDSNVGKSSSLYKFMRNEFVMQHDMTLGVDFNAKNIMLNTESGAEKHIKYYIWDTAGQEMFRSITRSYYRGCAGFILMFDLTDRYTFIHLDMWLKEIHKHCGLDKTEVLLVGNKRDLVKRRQVTQEEIDGFCELHNLEYMEISLKNRKKNEATELYTKIGEKILNKLVKLDEEDWPPGVNSYEDLTGIPLASDATCCVVM